MKKIQSAAYTMIAVGVVLILTGHCTYMLSHADFAYTRGWIINWALPGWALLLMGWTGIVGFKVWHELNKRAAGMWDVAGSRT